MENETNGTECINYYYFNTRLHLDNPQAPEQFTQINPL